VIRLAWRTALLGLVFLVVSALVAPLLPAAVLAAAAQKEPAPARLLLASMLTAGVLLALLSRTPGGLKARARLACLLLIGLQVNNLLELLIFDVGIPRSELPPFFLHAVASGLICGLLAAWIAGAAESALPETVAKATPGRLIAIVAAYVVIYFGAGLAVFPYVADFYDERTLPAHTTMLPMALLRGSVFAGLALAIARRVRASRGGAAVALGITFSLIGGVAPLLPENPFMPDAVRYAHMVEVAVSNLFFGAFAGWLLRRDETMSG
jgi:hypothetical protein